MALSRILPSYPLVLGLTGFKKKKKKGRKEKLIQGFSQRQKHKKSTVVRAKQFYYECHQDTKGRDKSCHVLSLQDN